MQQLLVLFGLWRQTIPHLQILVNLTDTATNESATLKGSPLQQKALEFT